MSGRPRGRASRRSPGPSSSRNRTVVGLDRAKDTFNTKMDIDPDMLRYGLVVDLGQVLYHFLKDPYSWPATYLILDLYYFLLAPTLCYQLNFPRNVIIRKWFLARRALEIVRMVYFGVLRSGILLSQLMIAMIQQEMDMTAKIKHVMELVAPNNFIWIILFYWFCHSVLNFMAELLKFGDREFYADWWHVYRPLLMQGFPQWQAQVIVYMVSAALCEAKMTLLLGRFSSGNYGNCLVWLCVLVGPPIAVLTYLHDYYMLNRESNAWSLY
ncbi:UNVERIFIED_CONTAM: hypothetical protein FKN15_046980 [Acipenser sinensis]